MTAVNLTVGLTIKRLEVLSITEYHGAGLLGKGTLFIKSKLFCLIFHRYISSYQMLLCFDLRPGVGRPVVFGFFQLANEVVGRADEVLDELKKNLTDKMLQDLPLLHGWL